MVGENRKLAAILSADVVGYSVLMADDEASTVKVLQDYRAAITGLVERHKGRVVNAPGDNILADFPSAVEAVQSASEIQQVLNGRNLELPDARRMDFRIGINLGDVIEEADGTIYGDGVNLAARMEALAEAGGICVSSSVVEAVEGKLELGFDFLGSQQVKNIERPIDVFRVRGRSAESSTEPTSGPPSRSWKNAIIAVIALVGVAGGAAWFILRPDAPSPRQAAKTPADSVLAMPAGPSIAVLPFENLSGDPEQNYFADGITDDIITRLSWFSDLRVVARSVTFGYKGETMDAGTLANKLNADYVLEGGIRRAGDDLRVTMRLFDAHAGTNVWAESFEDTFDSASLFEIQDKLTESVVSTIAGQSGVIARERVVEATRAMPEQMNSYECVLLASAFERTHSVESHRKARDCLEATVQAEPAYADAHAALSMIYSRQYTMGLNAESVDYDPLEKAYAEATRAVELEPANAQAHAHLAMIHFHRHEISLFRKHAMRAIELNPNDPSMLGSMGIHVAWSGDMEAGVPLVSKAALLNPNIPQWYYQVFAFEYFLKGEYAKGLEVIETHYGGAGYWDYIFQLFFLGHLGRHEEAAEIYQKLDEAYPGFSIVDARRETAKWNVSDEWFELISAGLRASGVPENSLTN